jgi:dihydroflavonol-4-reductase
MLLPLVSVYSKWTGQLAALTRESMDIMVQGHPRMDHKKATAELNFTPRPLEDTLRDFYHWRRENLI